MKIEKCFQNTRKFMGVRVKFSILIYIHICILIKNRSILGILHPYDRI
jgi:hypothetical protein